MDSLIKGKGCGSLEIYVKVFPFIGLFILYSMIAALLRQQRKVSRMGKQRANISLFLTDPFSMECVNKKVFAAILLGNGCCVVFFLSFFKAKVQQEQRFVRKLPVA